MYVLEIVCCLMYIVVIYDVTVKMHFNNNQSSVNVDIFYGR